MNRKKLRVLFYHRVNRYGDRFGIDPETFELQIRHLIEHYSIISMTEYMGLLQENKCKENAVLLTFDDGYKDNYTFAYPILKKYSIPAAIFLTTDFIDGKIWMWHDIFRYMVESTPLNNIEVNLNGHSYAWYFETDMGKLKARKNIYELYKDVPRPERIQKLKELAMLLKVNTPALPTEKYAPLSWDDIKEMSNNNIEFGSHACTHEILSKLNNEDAYHELAEAKKRIEDEIQLKVEAFAYPNGQYDDFTEETTMLLEKIGYKIAFTTISGMNNKSIDKFLHNRISVGTACDAYFHANILGLNFVKLKSKDVLSFSAIPKINK